MCQIKFRDSDDMIVVPKIICVGSNYGEHIREMKGSFEKPDPSEPVLFLKPSSAILHDKGTVIRPAYSLEMHHEAECVIVIGKPGKYISPEKAEDHILGYTIGLDMTLRDLQKRAKQRGEPWAAAKGFDTSAVIGEMVLKNDVLSPGQMDLRLWVNGQLKQQANTSDMIFGIKDIIAIVSKYFCLQRGDLIFTGTPSGVGPVMKGDRIKASLDRFVTVEVSVDEETI